MQYFLARCVQERQEMRLIPQVLGDLGVFARDLFMTMGRASGEEIIDSEALSSYDFNKLEGIFCG